MNSIVKVKPVGDQLELSECCVGMTQTKNQCIVYPGIEQCLSITGRLTNGLIGAHVSPNPSDRSDLLNEIVDYLAESGKDALKWYVVGNGTMNFVDRERKEKDDWWKSKKEVGEYLRKRLLNDRTILYYNTYKLAIKFQNAVYKHDEMKLDKKDMDGIPINIKVEHRTNGIEFHPTPTYAIHALPDDYKIKPLEVKERI